MNEKKSIYEVLDNCSKEIVEEHFNQVASFLEDELEAGNQYRNGWGARAEKIESGYVCYDSNNNKLITDSIEQVVAHTGAGYDEEISDVDELEKYSNK